MEQTRATAWSRGWQFTTIATLGVALGGLAVSGVWYLEASSSSSSTAAIGVLLATFLALPMASGAVLSGAALLLSRPSSDRARLLAGLAAAVVWGTVVLAASLITPR